MKVYLYLICNMKQFALLFMFLISFSAFSMNQDSLELVNIQQRITNIERTINSMRETEHQLKKKIRSLSYLSDSLNKSFVETNVRIDTIENHFNMSIDSTQSAIKNTNDLLSNEIHSNLKSGVICFISILLVIVFLCFIIHRRISRNRSTINEIKKTQKSLQEDFIKLDDKLISLLDKQLNIQQSTSNTKPADHSLALKVADEIVRIEMNLSRMDPSIKGYKQLAKAVERIKNNFLANGYEIIDMLGKPYNEGMKVVANFVSDEGLKQGEQVITGIIKPQINYNGQMIQAAQITVSQNI